VFWSSFFRNINLQLLWCIRRIAWIWLKSSISWAQCLMGSGQRVEFWNFTCFKLNVSIRRNILVSHKLSLYNWWSELNSCLRSYVIISRWSFSLNRHRSWHLDYLISILWAQCRLVDFNSRRKIVYLFLRIKGNWLSKWAWLSLVRSKRSFK